VEGAHPNFSYHFLASISFRFTWKYHLTIHKVKQPVLPIKRIVFKQ